MIIGICGYGFTGSGAVLGLLKEYDEPQVFDNAEIQEAFKVDGLQDLEYHLTKQYSRHISGDAAIKRFLDARGFYKIPMMKKIISPSDYYRISSEFINKLIQAEWYGIDNYDYSTKRPIYNFIVLVLKKVWFPLYEKITGSSYKQWPARKMYLSIKPEEFYNEAINYTNRLICAMGADLSKDIVLDQLFEANAPWNSFPFFSSPKAIVVDRDPRDVFLLAKYGKKASAETRFMPREDVETFVNYYKNLRLDKRIDDDRILYIQFEDLIYNYEIVVKKIEMFLGYSLHIRPGKYFKPEISIFNTQLFKNPKYSKDKKEIDYIEKYLSEYLFDYSKYRTIEDFKRAF